jgi:hypothetical protein
MDNYWNKIVKMTLTGQLSPSSATPILEAQLKALHLSIPSYNNTEQLVLKTIGSYAYLHKFAQKINTYSHSSEATYTSPDNSIDPPLVNIKYRKSITEVINQKYPSILEEILNLVISRKEAIPPSVLPMVLEYSKHKKYLHPLLHDSIGTLGIWLMKQNPEWEHLLPIDSKDKSIFAYGTKQERVRYLRALREYAPLEAIDQLRAIWHTENTANKVSFLETLVINLNDNDLPFLEECQDDKRKNVRLAAAQLLAQIPTSPLAQRMQSYLASHVTLKPTSNWKKLLSLGKKHKVWMILLEEDCSSEMLKDGILPQKKVLPRQGKKVNKLAQVIAKTPPSWWEQHYGLSPIDLIQYAGLEEEWFPMFFWGWSQAAHYYQNQQWLIALHKYQSTTWHQQLVWKEYSLPFFYTDLNPATFEKVVENYLMADQKDFLNQETPLTELLLQENYRWSLTLSKKILKAVQQAILSGEYSFQWNIKAILKRATFAAHPLLYAVIAEDWQYHTNNNQWGNWQRAVQNCLDLLYFRHKIHQ